MTTAGETTNDARDIFAALDSLDARRVAAETIVHSWNDTARTSEGTNAFYPTWGKNCNGTANIVNENIWQDTGEGGYGGPVVMALIDCGELSHRDATPRQPTGSMWRRGVDQLRDLGFGIPEFEGSSNEDLAALLPDLSEDRDTSRGVSREELTVDTARDRTTEAIADAYRSEDHRLIEALPTMGKSFGAVKAAAETREPISILTTRGREEQYAKIEEWCDQHDLSSKVLPSVMADCPTFAGEYDTSLERTVKTWYHNGASGSEIHQLAKRELAGPLPCEQQADERCGYKMGWEFEPGEYDVLIGNYVHANASKVTEGRTVVVDEFPAGAFEETLDRKLSSAVSRFLAETKELPFGNYTELLEKRHEAVKRVQGLEFFEDHNPERDGDQAISSDGHAVAPLATYTLLAGEKLGNGWERASLPETGYVGLYDRERGTIHMLMPPSFEEANGLVGLDGTPTPSLWDLALGEDLDHREVLNDEDEREAYIRECLVMNIVQTTTATKPYSNNQEWVNVEKDYTLLEAVADEHDEKPGLLTTKTALKTYESGSEAVLSTVDEYDNYPLEGSNEFRTKRVGAVVGSRHFGDGFVKKWGAYADEAVECFRGSGDLEYSGVGDDVLTHMREHQTLQAVMRFGRDANGATVYVHTNTLPEWVPIAGEGRVSTFGDKQREILESIMNQDGEFARRDLESAASARWTREFLKNLTEKGYLDREKRHGRNYYTIEKKRPRGLVDFDQ